MRARLTRNVGPHATASAIGARDPEERIGKPCVDRTWRDHENRVVDELHRRDRERIGHQAMPPRPRRGRSRRGRAAPSSASTRRRTPGRLPGAIEAAPQPHQVASTIPSTHRSRSLSSSGSSLRTASRFTLIHFVPGPTVHSLDIAPDEGLAELPHPPRGLRRVRHPLEPRARAGDRPPGQGLLGVRSPRDGLRSPRRQGPGRPRPDLPTGRSSSSLRRSPSSAGSRGDRRRLPLARHHDARAALQPHETEPGRGAISTHHLAANRGLRPGEPRVPARFRPA